MLADILAVSISYQFAKDVDVPSAWCWLAQAKGSNRRTAAEALVRVDPKLAAKCLSTRPSACQAAFLESRRQKSKVVTASDSLCFSINATVTITDAFVVRVDFLVPEYMRWVMLSSSTRKFKLTGGIEIRTLLLPFALKMLSHDSTTILSFVSKLLFHRNETIGFAPLMPCARWKPTGNPGAVS